MSIFQGSPLPSITTTETKAETAPKFYTDYLSGLSQAANTAMQRAPSEAIAGYDPLQTMGYAQLPTAAAAYQPGLSAAQATLGRASQGVTGERINALMNPYTTSVVDEMARLQQQSLQRNLLPTMKAGFVGSGGIGGQRYAGALGQALADVQRNLTGQQAAALQAGFGEAQKTALGELQPLAQIGQQQIAGSKAEQELGLTGAGALTKGGAERQAYEQALLDYPLKTATTAGGLLRGYQMPLETSASKTGPGSSGQYGQSPLASALGIMSAIGAATGGSSVIGPDGKPIPNTLGLGFGKIVDWGKGLLGSLGIDSGGVKEISNTSLPGQEGYGWKYYDNGTVIDPQGRYYFDGQMVYDPAVGDVSSLNTGTAP
jgi:hypothetical protein